MKKCIYLGIDIGTTSTKCLAVDEEGALVALAQRAYPMTHPHQGWAEQDPDHYWEALVAVVRECLHKLGKARQVQSLSLSTQGDTLIVADQFGKPLRPALSWMDMRAEKQFSALSAERDQVFWTDQSGQRLSLYSSANKIRWVRENEPQAAAGRFCYVADYLTRRLCGRFATDIPSASWTPLFNAAARTWSSQVCDLLEIESADLPDLVESGDPLGVPTPNASAELGLPQDTLVIAGAFDQAAAAHGVGALPSKRGVLSCGTAWVLYAVSNTPIRDELCQIPVCCHCNRGQWGMVLPFTGGSAYDWLQRLLNESTDTALTDSDPPVFIPHLYGGLCPDWREDSKGSIVGLTLSHSGLDIKVALMRGIASETRRNIEAVTRLSGRPDVVRMVGGATHSRTWPQLISNVLNLPVEISNNAESACYGAARLAAGESSSCWNTDAVREILAPIPEHVDREETLYQKYIQTYSRLLT